MKLKKDPNKQKQKAKKQKQKTQTSFIIITKKFKIPRNKLNQGDKEPVLRTLQDAEKRDTGVCHFNRLVESTSLKCPYYPKQFKIQCTPH